MHERVFESGKWLCFLAVLFVIGCSASDAPDGRKAQDGKPVIAAVNYPLAYFAERIVGDRATVVFPIPADVDPAYWKPEAAAVAEFQQADLILLNGAGYASWTRKYSLPTARLVNTSKSFADRYITTKETVVHSHGPSGEHSHQATAFTTWLDPQLAAQQAKAVLEATQQLLPDHRETLAANFAALEADLQQLDDRLTAIHDSYDNQPLLASHPVYQYLARRCGWNLQSLHWEPEEMPNDEQWSKLETQLTKHAAKWMIWEGPPTPAIEGKLQELGVQTLVYAPCGNRPDDGDFMSVMEANIRELQKAIPPQGETVAEPAGE